MRNIVLVLAVLFLDFGAACLFTHDYKHAGAIGLSGVFMFTALGHFLKGTEMQEMIPPFVPRRDLMVMLSGIFEGILAVGLLIEQTARWTAILSLIFLVLVLPLNIYSALRRVKFGGHGLGPSYLWIRVPLQLLLAWWAYWFVLR